MADYGAEYTDKKIEELEKRITSIYREASHDVEMKMRDFNKRYKAKEAIYAKKLKNGEITQEDFNAWKRGQVFQGKQWQAKKQQLEDTLYNANSVAVKMVNGETNGVFAANANYMSYSLEHGVGVNFGFGLYDESTVVNLIKNEPDLLPKPRIKKPKDTAWNSKKITRQVTQGIIQGESLDQIATRLAKTTGSQNRDAMLTHARTAMTGAQNAGRQRQLKSAQDLGIKLKKEWMATLDAHTRDMHRILDGQRVPINEPFEAGGYSIMYPGDPSAAPAMVYNCRCTMVADVEDYPAEYNRYDNIEGKPISNMTYREWEAAKKQNTATDNLNSVSNNDDILNLARSIIKSTGVNYSGSISMHPTLNNGECVISQSPDISKTCIYTEYNLNPNDTRPMEYRVKTAYHEAFHLSLNGKPWDAINKNWKINNDWCNIEETLTECAAHYKMKDTYGIYNLLPSYPYKLVWNLPRLKMLDEYSECSTIQDFGRIAWKNRVTSYDDKSGIWGSISRRVKKQKVGSEYFVQYHEYIEEHKDALMDKLVEGGVLPSNLKSDALNDLDTALGLVDRAGVMPGYDSGSGIIYYNVMAQAMQEVGVK